MDRPRDTAARLMPDFARRTGLSPAARIPRRYLWTDAFAVCNFLELYRQTSDQEHLRNATELIDQVHAVLGRYRDDDVRRGWISGLDEERGRRHPTSGGLRIGKRLKERGLDEAFDERLEWDRDGQYFHYLTKWMHALCRAGSVTADNNYVRWAEELAQGSFGPFVRKSASGTVTGVTWKMSTDLSRPLVPAVGLHDALDGLITFLEIEHAMQDRDGSGNLHRSIETLLPLCRCRDWTTDDPLGLGGLLFDACRLCRLPRGVRQDGVRLLEDLLQACLSGLNALVVSRYMHRPAAYRLAFRELGLAIGLSALPIIATTVQDDLALPDGSDLQGIVELLLPYKPLGSEITNVWLPCAHRPDEGWDAHRDINEVMLATALVPDMFLSVGGGFRHA